MQYLYIIKCQEFHKIGIANDVDTRLSQLSTGNPYPLDVVSIYGFPNAETVERALHQRYSDVRVRGEWFGLDDHDISDIDLVCKMLGGELIDTVAEVTEDKLDEADTTATSLYYFNCDTNGNHYVYTIDPNQKEPNGRKRRVYLWRFSDQRTQEYCASEAARWMTAHNCRHEGVK